MGNLERFLRALGERESGNRYDCVNSLGFTGKYQFGEAILIDLGYYEADSFYNGGGNGVSKCHWRGRWTNKAKQYGVHSHKDFRNNEGDLQDKIIVHESIFNTDKIIKELGGRRKFDEYLANSVYTYSGILAAAHLQGAWGAAELLKSGGRRCDEYGTCITEYARKFSGYDFGPYKFN